MDVDEIWKKVINTNQYEVSNFGNIRSIDRYVKNRWGDHLKKGVYLKPGIGKGYLQVSLRYNGKFKSRKVHQLVAESFLNHIPNGKTLVVNHID